MLDSASRAATTVSSCASRLGQHLLGLLLCPAKSTVTNLICLRGGQHGDWTADYRLYSQNRVDESALFALPRESILRHLPQDDPLVVSIDDTLTRKSGKKISGSGWKRDPLGPPFQTNLVHAQRYLQLSAAWPLADGRACSVPVDFTHAPSPPKPPRDASIQERKAYGEQLKQKNLNQVALRRIKALKDALPAERSLIICGDGSYTNKTIVGAQPEGWHYIGRTRKDLAVHFLPDPDARGGNGRPRRYGERAPTPEELRQDPNIPWQSVEAFAAGKRHEFRVKTIGPVLWRKSGAHQPLRLVVIAALGYRLRKGGKLLYRQPAYLLCTDLDLPLEKLLQYYLWRWGIEVNFRDEKSLIGTGEAQVRTEDSNQHLPATTVAAYSLLWTAALEALAEGDQLPELTSPKWRRGPEHKTALPSTGDLLRALRFQTWAGALRPATFSRFVCHSPPAASEPKPPPDLPAVLFAAA